MTGSSMTGNRARPRVVLVGAPGAGKSTVGRLVAERLHVSFRDTDEDIEALFGKPVAEIFYDEGEACFRAAEVLAVAAALTEATGVLALGGGAVLAAETRAALRGHVVVQLEVGLSEAASRVGLSAGRPVLALNPRATLKHLLVERAPLYTEVSTAAVATDSRTPQEVVRDVLAVLG